MEERADIRYAFAPTEILFRSGLHRSVGELRESTIVALKLAGKATIIILFIATMGSVESGNWSIAASIRAETASVMT